MTYKVMKQYARGADAFCADFANLKDAKAYIAENLGPEAAMGVKVTYKIVEFGDVIEEFDATKIPASPNAQNGSEESSSGGKGAGSRPTPLSTVPRPAGMPQTWGSNDDKEEEK